MSTSATDKRVDPLIDAYRQASELEAQTDGARPRAALRAAVLAHARVVAQSAASAEPKRGVSETVRAAPAANESKPVWRMVAGVVLGLAGMWLYQLTRGGTTDEANVAVMSARQTAKSAATESSQPSQSSGTTGAPVAPIAADAAASTAAASATARSPAPPETTVAIATLAKSASPAMTPAPMTAARDIPTHDRASGASNSRAVSGPRDGIADAARSDTSVALAKVDTPTKRAEQTATAAPAATTSAIPEVATSERLPETEVASAEMRKSMRSGAAARAPAAAAPVTVTAPPNAFPATASGAMAAAAPPPAAPAMSPPPTAVGASATPRQGVASTPDAALFSAIRAGNVNALRTALARGANVNARDETGRSALQIARDQSDTEMLKALELAGAK